MSRDPCPDWTRCRLARSRPQAHDELGTKQTYTGDKRTESQSVLHFELEFHMFRIAWFSDVLSKWSGVFGSSCSSIRTSSCPPGWSAFEY